MLESSRTLEEGGHSVPRKPPQAAPFETSLPIKKIGHILYFSHKNLVKRLKIRDQVVLSVKPAPGAASSSAPWTSAAVQKVFKINETHRRPPRDPERSKCAGQNLNHLSAANTHRAAH